MVFMAMASERQEGHEEARNPAHGLGLVRAPRPRDSMRAFATWVFNLISPPAWMASGSTVPEKRSTSTFWFTPICFSPATTRWPLGNTSTTVVVMEPEKRLALSVAPAPAKSLLVDEFSDNLPSVAADANGNAETPASIEEVRLLVEEDFWLAVTFSVIRIVTTSPTMRARRSSNGGR